MNAICSLSSFGNSLKDFTISKDIHVWYCSFNKLSLESLSYKIQHFVQFLSNDEIKRSTSFYFKKDKNQFVLSRALLRLFIAGYIGIHPNQVRFYYGSHGKPYIKEMYKGDYLNFSLSHSGESIMLAFASGRRVGVDIEEIKQLDGIDFIIEQNFSMEEKDVFNVLPKEERLKAFYDVWTRKEAYLKAIGIGISLPLNQVSVAGPVINKGFSNPKIQWRFVPLFLEGYSTTVCIDGWEGQVKLKKINLGKVIDSYADIGTIKE